VQAVPDTEPDPKAVVRDLSDQYRRIVARHLPEYERVIGLATTHHEFRERVIRAVSTCLFQHMLEPLTRPSQIRKDLLQASDAARKAHDNLCRLDTALNELPELVLRLLGRHWGLSGEIARGFIDNEVSWLRIAASLTDLCAKALAEKGGRPEMHAFRGLAKGLAKAFQIGTGRQAKVYWDPIESCWRGEFLKLVEAVLALVEALADALERPFQAPRSPNALGQYLHDLTRLNTRAKNRVRSR
jgi:hypothetical protein